MSEFIELFESRVLFSNVGSVTADYNAIVSDAAIIKNDFVSAATTYKNDAKLITTDIKALGKSKTNTKLIAAVNKAVATGTGADTKAGAALITAGKAAINKTKSAFLADLTKPTAAHAAALSKALATLSVALIPTEAKIATAVATGDANVNVALNALVAANPTDTTLATNVSDAETDQASSVGIITGAVTETNADILALVDAIS